MAFTYPRTAVAANRFTVPLVQEQAHIQRGENTPPFRGAG
jgi:hypothetical protein